MFIITIIIIIIIIIILVGYNIYQYLIAYYNECNCSTAPPRFTSKPPPLIFIKEGGNLTLSISVFGNPQPKITWSVRLKIHENESRVNSTGDEKFKLNYIRFEDEGVITCRAENVFGVQETEVELTVLGKFIIINIFFLQNVSFK